MKAEAGVEIMRKPLIVLIKLSLWYCELKTAVTVIKMDDNVFQGKYSLHYIDNSFQRVRKIVNSTKTITVLFEKNK